MRNIRVICIFHMSMGAEKKGHSLLKEKEFFFKSGEVFLVRSG